MKGENHRAEDGRWKQATQCLEDIKTANTREWNERQQRLSRPYVHEYRLQGVYAEDSPTDAGQQVAARAVTLLKNRSPLQAFDVLNRASKAIDIAIGSVVRHNHNEIDVRYALH